jgi:hypothetical protein
MKRIAAPLLFVILLGALAAWWFSDTQVLKRRTHSLLSTLTFEAGIGKTSRHLGAYTLNSILAPSVDLETPTISQANGTFERSELESAYSWLCEQAKQTHFEVIEFRSISITGEQAKMKVVLNGLVELPTYRPADGRYEVNFDWQRSKDGWRLSRAQWTQKP